MNSYLFSLTAKLSVLFLILFLHNCAFCLNDKDDLSPQDIGTTGKIEETFRTNSDLWIVHIKDAHCNFEAQLNTSKIIKKLLGEFGFSLVCMEGCASALDVSDLSSFPDDSVKNDVTMSFLKKGNINGVEYLSVMNPQKLDVEGVEDKNLYIRNYNSFYKSLSFRKKAGNLTSGLKNYLSESKHVYFCDNLLQLDSIYEKYTQGKTDIFNLFNVLRGFCSKYKIDYENLKNIKLLENAVSLNASIDFGKVEQEKDAIIKVFLKYCTDQERQNIINTNIKYKFHQISINQYHDFISKKCDEYLIESEDYPNFNKYIMYSRLLDKIDRKLLADEIETLVSTIKKKLYTNKESEFIDTLYNKCSIITQAFELSMLPAGAKRLAEISDNFKAVELFKYLSAIEKNKNIPVTQQDLYFIKNALSYVSEFYTTAEKRNFELINNTLRIMKNKKLKKCVLYTGGFHTEGITRILKEKEISYTVVSPKIGTATEDDPYFYLITNTKDPFINALERNFIKNITLNSGALALESKLVPVSEAMIDQAGAKAFRDTLKTFFFGAGIQKALSEIEPQVLQTIMESSENELIQLSERIKDIHNWKNSDFSSLEEFSITRNGDSGIDLRIKINGQDFFINNIVSPQQRKSFYMHKYNVKDPDCLTTLRINGEPLSIYQSPSNINHIQITENIDDAQLSLLFSFFSENDAISEEELATKSGIDGVTLKNLINYAVINKILNKNDDNTLSIAPDRKPSVISASALSAQKTGRWKSITEIDNTLFPQIFRELLRKNNIVEIQISPYLNFAALLFMFEGLPSQFADTVSFPKNETENFVFRKEKIIGKDGFRLTASIEKKGSDIVLKERSILLGNRYETVLNNELFGLSPAQSPQIIMESSVESPVVYLDNPPEVSEGKQKTEKLLIWANPEITETFWREINSISIDYNPDQFLVSGGLIFGKQEGNQYLVTNIVSLDSQDYSYQSEDAFAIREEAMRALLDTYATDGIKLIGIYGNHSIKRLVKLAKPGVDKRDTFTGFPFDGSTDKVVAEPLGIIFEPRISAQVIERFNQMGPVLPAMVINPDAVEIYFYNVVNGQPVVIHQGSAVNIVNPGEKILADAGRNLFLRRIQDKQAKQETDVVTFRRLPNNNGFAVIANQSISKEELQYFVQFFRSIRKEIETYTSINEIKIKTGMRNSAHSNKIDNVLEFNMNILEYPALIKYLALPHEWNHFQLNLDEGTEELIAIMLDLNRISELAVKDQDSVLKYLAELEKFETLLNGKQLFFETIKKVIGQTKKSGKPLSAKEIFLLAKEFALSDPELAKLISEALTKKSESYFTDLFAQTLKSVQTELPPILPGEADYIVFDEDIFSSQQSTGKILDFMMINVKYLDGDSFKRKTNELNQSPDTNFSDTAGYFDPSKKEIGINMSGRNHINDDGTINPDSILSTIIHQRTHHFIAQNKNILNTILEKMRNNDKVREEIIRLFFLFKKGQDIGSVTQIQLSQLANDPVFGSQNMIDFENVLAELICCVNEYNSIPAMLNKFNDIKAKMEKDNMRVPASLESRIGDLNDYILSPERIKLYQLSENAHKYLLALDKQIDIAFRIPNLSTLHVYLMDDESQITNADTLAMPLPIPQTEKIEPQPITSKPAVLTENPVEIDKLNSFFRTWRISSGEAPSVSPTYTREIAYQNAQEFYDYLRAKHAQSPDTSLPAEINIVDLFLGTPEFAKDFLDKFKQIDINNLFYARLRYHIVSHSKTSKIMLENMQKTGVLKNHGQIVRYGLFSSISDIKVDNPLLVRSFGDTSHLDNILVVEKKDSGFFEITLQPSVDISKTNDKAIAELQNLLANPESVKLEDLSKLSPNIMDAVSFSESPVPVNIDDIPFGLFLKSFTENKLTGKFIYHPQLLSFFQETLTEMSIKFGGYIQFFGTSFNSLEPIIEKKPMGLTELDSLFLSAMISKQGGFLSESQQNYLLRKTKHTPISAIADGLRELPANELARIMPAITFADISSAARIFNLRQDPTYKSADNFTFQRFIRDIKQKGWFAQNITPQLLKDPSGKDDFIYSLNESVKKYPLQGIAQAVINTLADTRIDTETGFIESLKAQPDIKNILISDDYLKRIVSLLNALAANQKNFHLRAEMAAPISEPVLTDITQIPKKDKSLVYVRRLSGQQFKSYIEEIKRDNPYIDFGDPRGIANPVNGEIILNMDHPAHKDKMGNLNLAEIRQTLIHEQSHMLIFANWELLVQIAKGLKGKEYVKDEILKLFYEFYFDEKVDSISSDHKDRLKADPLWSENGEISYERILSELLAIINQYQMLPIVMKRLSAIQTKYIMKNKAIPQPIKLAIDHMTEIFKTQRPLIAATVAARAKLKTIDNRISQNFIFNAFQLKTPIDMASLDKDSLPLPSTPVKTLFSFDELEAKVSGLWNSIGSGDITAGKSKTVLAGLQITEFSAAIDKLKDISSKSETDTQEKINKIIRFWNDSLTGKKIHLYPTSPESYTITGTHFIHTTKNDEIIIPSGYYNYLRETGQLAKALATIGAKQLSIDTTILEDHFEGDSIGTIEQNLYNTYLRNRDYVPVIESILKLYGISIDDISQKTLTEIVEKYEDVLKIPGAVQHLEKVREILTGNTLLDYKKSPLFEAFEIYASASLSAGEVNTLKDTAIEMSAILARETSPPIIFLIDSKAISGPVSPQNFAIRETLGKIRNEIESLEKRKTVIIAVDLNGKAAGEIRNSLDTSLLRKGASSDDFDYVVSFQSSDELMNALREEYSNIPGNVLKSNIKVLAVEQDPLIDLAKSTGLQYREINETFSLTKANLGEGLFLIDYLRSLGLNQFITGDNTSDMASELRNSIYVMSMPDIIDLNSIPDKFKPLVSGFAEKIKSSAQDLPFSNLVDSFTAQEKITPTEIEFLTPLLEEQFQLTKIKMLFDTIQSQENSNIDKIIAIYKKLQIAFTETSPTQLQKVVEKFYAKLNSDELGFINDSATVVTSIQSEGKANASISQKELDILYVSKLINRLNLTDTELFSIENRILKGGTKNPVSFAMLMAKLDQAGISVSPQINRYFVVDTAPRKIQKELRTLMTTQKLFDESA